MPIDPLLGDFLLSLEHWCDRTAQTSKGMTAEVFLSDNTAQLALSMCIVQIGEASGRILRKWPEFAVSNPQLELINANAIRHRLVHGYEQSDMMTLWDTIRVSIPAMHAEVRKLMIEHGIE